MKWRWTAILVALASESCVIPVDMQGAEAIPTEVALSGLQDLLPRAAYVSCTEPRASFLQSDVLAWTVDEKGLEFRTRREEPFRLLWSASRGAELARVPLSYEVRVFMATPTNPRVTLFHFNWRDEAPARRAAELFEALRGDR
ncbi:MAG TPA: hypothetical protein VMU54_06725 [Planctomycetota bacterium]|nr:hypothetical protein [Planctomycetota bacterium]